MSTLLDIAVIHFRGEGKKACDFFPVKKRQIERPILKKKKKVCERTITYNRLIKANQFLFAMNELLNELCINSIYGKSLSLSLFLFTPFFSYTYIEVTSCYNSFYYCKKI